MKNYKIIIHNINNINIDNYTHKYNNNHNIDNKIWLV